MPRPKHSFRKCQTIREKIQRDVWVTFNTHSILGGAPLCQKRCADAEPLLVKGYEGMKKREKSIPPQAAIRVPKVGGEVVTSSSDPQ